MRNLKNINPDFETFPDFDDNLRQAMQHETDLFFGNIIHEDHSVLDLLNANYTFINERLARHYGIPNIYGTDFRRVALTDRTPPWAAGTSQHSDHYVVCERALRRCSAANGF